MDPPLVAVKLPRVPSALKPPSPSSVAPGSRGPKRLKTEPFQPTREDFDQSAWKKKWPQGSYPEYLTYWALTAKLKMKAGVDFVEQFDLGKEFVGGLGAVVDVVIINRFPWLGLAVMGLYFHPAFGKKLQYDLAQFARIRNQKGWDLIPLDEDDLERDAVFTVKEALRGNDMSRYRGRT